VQYGSRVDSFDYDIVIDSFQVSSVPGENLRSYFTSQSAATKGSLNFAGIADPVIDALVERIVAATTRPELIAACRALDRVFRAGHYWIPHWHTSGHRIAYWDLFGRPATKPRYGRGIPETWWYDRDKAAKIERAG
jgi:microcin C transport system substrate-binding protein